MERTEEQKVTRAPVIVVLGGREFEIVPLVIRDSRKWRVKAVEALSSLPKYAKVTTDDVDQFGEALNSMLVQTPDTVVDLFFNYAKELNREEIEAIATDEEIAEAFRQVVKMAFPLAQSLVGAMVKVSQ